MLFATGDWTVGDAGSSSEIDFDLETLRLDSSIRWTFVGELPAECTGGGSRQVSTVDTFLGEPPSIFFFNFASSSSRRPYCE